MADPRLARPLWRGRTNVDAYTIGWIEHAEAIVRQRHPEIAHEFVVTQGSYQGTGGDPDSGTTHSKGGGVDLRWCGHPECYRALRLAGGFIWHRTPAQGDWADHFHGAPLGHPFMDSRLAAQENSYLLGGNGLGGDDDGPRLQPIPRPVWPWPPEDDLNADDRRFLSAHFKATNDRIAALEELVDRLRQGSFRRDQRLIKKVTGIDVDLVRIEKAASELPEEDG